MRRRAWRNQIPDSGDRRLLTPREPLHDRDDRGTQDDDEERREDAEHQREEHLHRRFVRLLLSALTAPHAELLYRAAARAYLANVDNNPFYRTWWDARPELHPVTEG